MTTVEDKQSMMASAQRAFDTEVKGLVALRQRVEHEFARAIDLLLNIEGRVVVTGMGKSGHIGN